MFKSVESLFNKSNEFQCRTACYTPGKAIYVRSRSETMKLKWFLIQIWWYVLGFPHIMKIRLALLKRLRTNLAKSGCNKNNF